MLMARSISRVVVPLAWGLMWFPASAAATAAWPAKSTTPAALRSRGPAGPQFTRTLVLVRHGAYDENDPRDPEIGRSLTPTGREQARLTARRLAHFALPIDVLRSSMMTRARETAAIIGDSLPGREPRAAQDLSECTPPTEREDITQDHDLCRQRLDRAYAALFRPSSRRDSTEVVVCHGNVIRYFVCKALGIEPSHWLRLAIQNCSISVLRVRADRIVQLVSFDDYGHLPPELVTVLRPARPDPGPAHAVKPDSSARGVR